jgi:sulfur dioxygenase
MIFRQLLDYETFTYTFILGDEKTREAVIIDPVIERVDRDVKLLNELKLKLKYIIDTHVHADHITGSRTLLQKFPDAHTVLGEHSGALYKEGLKLVKDGEKLYFGDRFVTVVNTPGHTNGCISLVLDDKSMVFTGDALFVRGCGRTDFQQGNSKSLFESITKLYKMLPDHCLVYPGHDYNGHMCSTIEEEKEYNPRLNAKQTLDGFVNIMQNLKLAPPKKIKESVPANLYGGLKE